MRRRIFLTLALALLLCAVITTSVLAAEIDSGKCGTNATWSLDSNGTLTVSGRGSVSSASWSSHYNHTYYVIIEDGITALCKNAFYDFYSLETVDFGSTMETIGGNSFNGCVQLEKIYLPDSVTTVGGSAFYGCTGLDSVRIGENVTSIGKNAFGYCANAVMYGVEGSYAESYASLNGIDFEDESSFDSVASGKCGDSVTWSLDSNGILTISGSGAMTDYTNYPWPNTPWYDYRRDISSVVVKEGVTTIGDFAFSETNLTSVSIPSTVTSIGNGAFDTCYHIKSVNIPVGVKSIGDEAFYCCSSLGEIIIPSTVETIGFSAFSCTNITEIVIPDSVKSLGVSVLEGCLLLERVTLPKTLESLPSRTFANCRALKSITLPESVKTLESTAFDSCTALETVKLGNKVETLEPSVFFKCSALTSINLPDTLTAIHYYVFRECTSLKSLTVPASVTYIGDRAIGYYYDAEYKIVDGFVLNCYKDSTADEYARLNGINLKYIDAETDENQNIAEGIDGNISWFIDANGVLTVSGEGAIRNYTKSYDPAPWQEYKLVIKSIVISDGITAIGDFAFYNLTKATSISVPASVESVGLQFIRGTLIENITLSGLVSAVINSFGRADSLKAVTLGESAKDFKGNIFYQQTVTIIAPESSYAYEYAELFNQKYGASGSAVTAQSDGTVATKPVKVFAAAGDNAFCAIYERRTGVWDLEISGSGKMKNFPYICDKNEKKGYTFTPMYYVSQNGEEINVKTIKVHEGITSIGNYAFYRCTKATSVELPETVTSIGRGAFWVCARLQSIILPEAVTEIGNNAFNGCGALTSLYIPAGVDTFGEGVFIKCNTQSLTVKTKSAKALEIIRREYSDITINSEY